MNEPVEVRLIRQKVKARREAIDKWLVSHQGETYDVGGLVMLETLIRWIDEIKPPALASAECEQHHYRITCEVCGQVGVVKLDIVP